MRSQAEKGRAFASLHEEPGCFVIPNPWDPGTARILAAAGFRALATTSAGLAFTLGRKDGLGLVTRDEALLNAGQIASATDLPVTADLENGYGESPETVAETIILAASSGLVGASIEDSTGNPDRPIYDFSLGVERIVAAANAAKVQNIPFTLTARAENYLHGRPDLRDTIARLQAYRAAGADVLYAPGLTSLEEIRTVAREVNGPINVVMGLAGAALTVAELEGAGVKRISLGSSLNRAALGAMMRAAREILDRGTFDFSTQAPSARDIYHAFDPGDAAGD